MERIETAMQNFEKQLGKRHKAPIIPFETFLQVLTEQPHTAIRNVFQIFHDMVQTYVGEGVDEYPDDPESIHFVSYDCNRLFVEGADNPFFADRLFANRLIDHVAAMRRGAQQNKIYIFDGPPGCGKSTFLNNLLRKFEEYTKTEAGSRFEAVWRLERKDLCAAGLSDWIPQSSGETVDYEQDNPIACGSRSMVEDFDPCFPQGKSENFEQQLTPLFTGEYVEVPCPSHDHPILMIPKHYRRQFFDDVFSNDEFKWKLFTEKEYEWVFKEAPCTICSSIYWALLNRLQSVRRVFDMLYARPYAFNRRLGEGISVFNPGDKPMRQNIMSNPMLQSRINGLLRDSNQVRYIFSRYAKTNNGIYALMDIKSHNVDRLIELHNIISEGLHKVEDIEENVNSLLMALMNPEDKKNISDFQSFSDRIEYIRIPYVLDLKTEVAIYRNIFGKHIDRSFLPRVLHNFARVIISSRLNTRSAAMMEWIGDPAKYKRYCDDGLLLLKMEIYTGYIPTWLTEEDRKRFTAKRRRKIIGESEIEGVKGFSGRDSIRIFGDFISRYARENQLINMSTLCLFFKNMQKESKETIPQGFLEALLNMYDYTVLQEVKESLYYYNEEQIARDLKNYLFAINFEIGTEETCNYTGDKIVVTEEFFNKIEDRLLNASVAMEKRRGFRKDTQKEYSTRTLPQEIVVGGMPIEETKLYLSLYDRYVFHLKEKVLDPLLKNENFRQAIKDFGEEGFKSYDRKIQDDVTFLIRNLCEKSLYTEQGAKEVCMYVIDNNLAEKFASA